MSTSKKVLAALFVGGLGFGTLFGVADLSTRPTYADDPSSTESGSGNRFNLAHDLSRAFKAVASNLQASVVSISSVKVLKSPTFFHRSQPFFDGPFRDFFKRGDSPHHFRRLPTPEQKQTGMGTGVIVSEDGYILTNNHVVEGADELVVKLSDDRELVAKVIGGDKETDIALVKIDTTGLKPVMLGNSDRVEVGEWVLAMGSPFGLSQTLTAGIVSAKGRGDVGIVQRGDFIQTDAAINPGNSGGPLANLNGEVIGINTAIFSRNGGYMGIGFAIPINLAKRIMDSLRTDGKVVRGYLGIWIQNLDKNLAESFDLESTDGALVGKVAEGSPADEGGLEEGDIVLEVDGRSIKDTDDLRNTIANITPGNKAKLLVLRDGREKKISIHVGEHANAARITPEDASNSKLGMSLRTLTPDLAGKYGVGRDLEGVLVTGVEPLGAADKARIRAGDVILSVQGRRVRDVDDFRHEIAKRQEGGRLKIRRGDNNLFTYLGLKK